MLRASSIPSIGLENRGARRRLDNEGERTEPVSVSRDLLLRGGSQCPWIGSLESSSTSSLTMRMAGSASVFVGLLLFVSSI